MNVSIRNTVDSDLPEIFRIRTDPLVRPHQYKLSFLDSESLWATQLFGPTPKGNTQLFKCTSILRDGQLVGHISRIHYKYAGQNVCTCGWNISPSHWGNGIVTNAVTQLFDLFFYEQQVDVVISDCFSNNYRGLRVLNRLNYQPSSIAWRERLGIMMSRWCFHKILRFHLNLEMWENRKTRTPQITEC